MKLACLFWFYKSPEVCENHLRLLRSDNPHLRVYGLYGGEPSRASEYAKPLAPYLDDFYTFPEERTAFWKWYHGDRMIARWFTDRGHALEWDTVFVMQWDMLVFGPLERQFRNLRQGQLLMSGLRPVAEVDPWWSHIRPETADRARYEEFLGFVRTEYAYADEPMCGQFLVACLPREFLARYATIREPELGFLEYTIPIYAQIFGIPFCRDHPHRPWWEDEPQAKRRPLLARALNADLKAVPLRVVAAHRLWPWGRRIFHPVFEGYPLDPRARMAAVAREVYVEELKRRWWNLHERFFGKR